MEEEDGVQPVVKNARSTTVQKTATCVAMEEVEMDDPKAVMNQNQVKESLTSDPLFTFQPGEYEIVLCVDNAETSGKYVYFRDHFTVQYSLFIRNISHLHSLAFIHTCIINTPFTFHNPPRDCMHLLVAA